MSVFSIDDLIAIAEHSRWSQKGIARGGILAEKVYSGRMRVEKREYMGIEVAKYQEDKSDVYRLIVESSGKILDVIYGDDAMRILGLAETREKRLSKFSRNADKLAAMFLRRLKKHIERYENGQQ